MRRIVRELEPFAGGASRRYVYELDCGHVIARHSMCRSGSAWCDTCEAGVMPRCLGAALPPPAIPIDRRPLWKRALEARGSLQTKGAA